MMVMGAMDIGIKLKSPVCGTITRKLDHRIIVLRSFILNLDKNQTDTTKISKLSQNGAKLHKTLHIT